MVGILDKVVCIKFKLENNQNVTYIVEKKRYDQRYDQKQCLILQCLMS